MPIFFDGAKVKAQIISLHLFLAERKVMISDFNLVATTSRGNERPMCNELYYLLKDELGDPDPQATKTKIRGLIVAKTTLDPFVAIEKLRAILKERPYEFRYALRIVPIERVVPTDLQEIKRVTQELATQNRRQMNRSGLQLRNASQHCIQKTSSRQPLQTSNARQT